MCHRQVCRNVLLSSCNYCKCCITQHPYDRVEVYCIFCVYMDCIVEDETFSSECVSAVKEHAQHLCVGTWKFSYHSWTCKGQHKDYFLFRSQSCNELYRLSSSGETVHGIVNYCGMIKLWLMSQILEDKPNAFQHDGATRHWKWGNSILAWAVALVMVWPFGGGGSTSWPPHYFQICPPSPTLSLTFFLRGFVKMRFTFCHCLHPQTINKSCKNWHNLFIIVDCAEQQVEQLLNLNRVQ